uniref:Uncharacterized protein n=1 Tax=Anguilla anguilla TaxID=7936 RepID=A0A0E9RCV1_ANGAN
MKETELENSQQGIKTTKGKVEQIKKWQSNQKKPWEIALPHLNVLIVF